jgi:hypothetical protein
LLRSRIEGGSGEFGGNSGNINRSSSAPPAHFMNPADSMIKGQYVDAFELNDKQEPRVAESILSHPDYAAYYHNNARLDPRLPPPIVAPGQSWQMWSGNKFGAVQRGQAVVEGEDDQFEADPDWRQLRDSIGLFSHVYTNL